MLDTLICPYCAERSADSDDHVFPQFLGGKSTIRACTECNNTFGHSFESSTFEHFKDWMFVFRRSGMKTPRPMVWRKVALDMGGNRYDIDQDLKAVLSDPILGRDQNGKIVQAKGNPAKLKRIAASLKRKGLNPAPIELSKLKIDLRSLTFKYPLDENLRRLTLKMTLAVSRRLGYTLALSPACQTYLLTGKYSEYQADSPVRIALRDSADLKALRPPLGHLIYLHHSETEQRSYSVVQFFGAIQFYCELNMNCDLQGFSLVGTHDPVNHYEEFREVEPIDFPLPAQFLSKSEWHNGIRIRFEAMRRELVELYGNQAPSKLFLHI